MRTLNVAVAGLGFMGATHARAWMKTPGARLAAVVSSDERKLAGDLTGISGNLDLAADPVDFTAVRKYRNLDEALNDASIEAIDICLPTDRHAPAALQALDAGKHVLVEKPMALDPADCRKMLDEASKQGRILMTGQVLRFIPAWRMLAALIQQSGPVRSAFFRRVCGAPGWSSWLGDPKRSGGGIFDLLIHDVDFCVSVWGMPESVRARGYECLARGIDVVHAELIYPGLGPVIISGGWHHPKSYPFSMEFTVVTDAMTVDWNSREDAFREYRADGESELCILDEVDPFVRELTYFAECALAGKQPELCPAEQSAQAVELMIKLVESRSRGGEPVSCL